MGEAVDIAASRGGRQPELSEELKLFVDVLKRELDEEFRIAERLDAKARGYLTAATVAAAGTQAAAIVFIARAGPVLGALAAVGAIVVVAYTAFSARTVLAATGLHENESFPIDYAEDLLPHAYYANPPAVEKLAEVMLRMLKSRRAANGKRTTKVNEALSSARTTTALIALELALLIAGFGVYALTG